MDWDTIASSRIDDLTKPKSVGRPTNHHVVAGRESQDLNFERIRQMVHAPAPIVLTGQ